MTSLKILAILSILFFPVAICHGLEKLENKSIAVMEPGVGIGNIKIGDNLTDVLRKMSKKPSNGKTVKTGKVTEYWIDYTDLGITFIFDKEKILNRIAVANPGIIIKQKGLRVNNTIADLDRLYGSGETRKMDNKYEQRIYKDKGISFTINTYTQKIEVITIEKVVKAH